MEELLHTVLLVVFVLVALLFLFLGDSLDTLVEVVYIRCTRAGFRALLTQFVQWVGNFVVVIVVVVVVVVVLCVFFIVIPSLVGLGFLGILLGLSVLGSVVFGLVLVLCSDET